MPAYRDREARKLYMREYRRRKREAARICPVVEEVPDDPVDALQAWSREKLVVPPGHPRQGQPMVLPDFAVRFLREGWDSHESALSVGRKNAKSAVAAILVLGFLAGPLRQPGWRGAVCSVSKEKAGELRSQVAAIAEASKLSDVHIRRSPYPGAISSSTGIFETLSSDRSSGHSSSFDLVICDETGLMQERCRDLLGGLRSSVSAKAGKIVHISIRGDSPLYGEILDNPANLVHVYAAPDGCALDDREAWKSANPGLGTIKQVEYMEKEVERIKGAPGDEGAFRAFDLNAPISPAVEMILSPDDLRMSFVDIPSAVQGDVVLGLDIGDRLSGTAATAIWPATGLMKTWLAFGDNPALDDRARRDNAPYRQMLSRGELRLFPGRVVPVVDFLGWVAERLGGSRVVRGAADGYKQAETEEALEQSSLRWPVEFRRVGLGKDGARDCRAFQRIIHQRRVQMTENLSLVTAISQSKVRRDANGNAALDKANSRGRIDVLSAAVLASGLAEPLFDRPSRPLRYALAG